MENLSVTQYLVLCIAGAGYGFTKTGVMGVSSAIVPLMLCFFTPGQSLGIALPVLIFADFVTLYILRKSVVWRHVAVALPWGVAGVLVGWRFLIYTQTLPTDVGNVFLSRVIAGVMVVVVLSGAVLRYLGRKLPPASPDLPSLPITPTRYGLAALVSFSAGGATMISNNGGPAWVVYMMLFRLDKLHFLGSVAWIIFGLNLAKLPFSIQLGYVDASTLRVNVFMIPLVLFGLFSGKWVLTRISQRFFDNLVQLLALAGALYLLLR